MQYELTFMPLGGLGAIGMNSMMLRSGEQRWLIDCGIMFPDDTAPSAELVLPDLDWIEAHAESLCGVVLTHGHEDHIGALPYLLRLKQLNRLPIYGTRFTLQLVRRKLSDAGIGGVELRLLEPNEPQTPPESPELSFQALRVSHSIPDAAAIAIGTPLGTILHTGDFKIESDGESPGNRFDTEAFRRLGDAGVLLMFSDSTNALVPGWTRSEEAVAEGLATEIGKWPGRVLVTQFASNLWRLRSLERVARQSGRKLCLVGGSLYKYADAADAVGIPCPDTGRTVDPDRLNDVDPKELLVVMTGSQGEPRAALCRAATGSHTKITIGEGDLLVHSARVIPGNDRRVYRMFGDLARRGATILSSRQLAIHASGHAKRDELQRMLDLVRPRFFVPVHGEYTFLAAHRELADACSFVEQSMLLENGQELRVDPSSGLSQVAEHALEPHYLDARITGVADTLRFSDRRKMLHNGHVAAHVAVVRNGRTVTADVELRARGIYTHNGRLLNRLATDMEPAICGLGPELTADGVEDLCTSLIRRFFYTEVGRRPLVDTFVTIHVARRDSRRAT